MLNKALMLLANKGGTNLYDLHIDLSNAYHLVHPVEIDFYMKVETSSYGFIEEFSTVFTTDEQGMASVELPDWTKYDAQNAIYWVQFCATVDFSQNWASHFEDGFPFKKDSVNQFYLYDNS